MKVEISIGGLVDRVSILSIKLSKIKDPEKLKNIRLEYDMLVVSMQQTGIDVNNGVFKQLQEINLKLWDIENGLRSKEAKKEFDDEFIELARSVYINNDERAALKRKISIDFGSAIIEENEYSQYQNIPYSIDTMLLRARAGSA
jgi:predicted DNA-binding antitoxin AbrB/MazE fold protein